MTPLLLKLAVSMGETLEGHDLSKGAYARLGLGGGVFTRVNLSEADLRGADLREAVFDQCDLRGMLATGAQMRRAVFNRCLLDHADLRRCDLHGAVFAECDLVHVQLSDAMLAMATVSKCKLDHAVLRAVCLDSALLSQSSLLDVCLDDTSWQYTTTSECDLTQLSWVGARMLRNNFFRTSLKNKSFDGLQLEGCQFSFADLAGADKGKQNHIMRMRDVEAQGGLGQLSGQFRLTERVVGKCDLARSYFQICAQQLPQDAAAGDVGSALGGETKAKCARQFVPGKTSA